MAIKFQYNKTSLGELEKGLKMRVQALPTIKSKEAALRVEVQKAREKADGFERELQQTMQQWDYMAALWGEFDPSLVHVEGVEQGEQKIAGVAIPVLHKVLFEEREWDLFASPAWWADGVEVLRRLVTLRMEHEYMASKTALLEYARKKTTQKVNLYEKVQIPDYEEAIRKIKRFMEDEENLSKSSQKIVKARQRKEVRA
jgi:V/A-type H+-transporting ATPase subunit D